MVLEDSVVLLLFVIYIIGMLVEYWISYENRFKWKHIALCLVFPATNFAIHGNDIIIAFTQDSFHASGVAMSYAILLMLNVVMGYLYKKFILPHHNANAPNVEGKCHLIIVNLFFLVCALLLDVFFGGLVGLYFLLPINKGFESAARQVFSTYQTLIVVVANCFPCLLVCC